MVKKQKRVVYDHNNSGGLWWLEDEDWKALEKAGWEVKWHKDAKDGVTLGRERFLGALASSAIRYGLSLQEAVEEWECITHQSALAAGCPCCGQPHSFTEYDADGKYVDSGPSASYEAHW